MKILRIIKKPEDIKIPKGMTRTIKFGVAHTTAGPQNQSTEEIFNFWKRVNKWVNVGYHFDINADGTIEQLMELDGVANGVLGFNQNSIHFCYKGGIDSKGKPIDNRTDAQKESMLLIIMRLKELFPNIVFLGHRDFSTDKNGNGIIDTWEFIKSCPCFDLREWLTSVGLGKEIIPAKIVYKFNRPLIKNETVKAIQIALKFTGDDIDGIYGQDTTDAVINVQNINNIPATGVVDERTAKLLIKQLDPKLFWHGEYALLLSDIKNN